MHSRKELQKWTILETEDVSPSPWYPIERHTVQLPNGHIVDDYYVSSFGEIAMVLPFLQNGQLVLVKQYKHGIQEVVIELPAGIRKPDQTIEAAALAELEEETGIKTTLSHLKPLGPFANSSTKSENVTVCFLATDLEVNTRQRLDPTEEIEVLQRTPKQVLQMIQEGQIWVSDTVACILKVKLLFPELFDAVS